MAKATEKTEEQFDAKANKAAALAERADRKAGKDVKTTRFIVNPGQVVRKGGIRYEENEAIDLSPADADRLTERGTVSTPKAAAKAEEQAEEAAKLKEKADKAAAAAKDAEKAAAKPATK